MPDIDRLRLETAQRIAADIAENASDWAGARARVLDDLRATLGKVPANAIPSSAEIEAAVREHYAIFCPEEHAQVLARKRSLALALLESLSEFDAFLTGAVLNGCAHEESNIVLDIFCDDVKLVEAALIDRRIEFEPVDSPRSAMPEPLESLGALIFSPRTHEAEGVRFDVRASIDRSRNPFRRHPDAHQASWEAQGRINAADLRAALESLES